MARVDAVRPFRARTGLAYVGGLFAGGIGLSEVYAVTGLGVTCPFRALTGWSCPLCGGTRMGAALLDGQIATAFALNPVALVALTVVGVLGLLWAVEVAGGLAVRPPRMVSSVLRRVPSLVWLGAGLTLAALYTVVRNLA